MSVAPTALPPHRDRRLVLDMESGRITDDHDGAVATWHDQSVLSVLGELPPRNDSIPRVMWSGSYAQIDPHAELGDGVHSDHPLFRDDPRTWMAGFGWKALAGVLERWSAASAEQSDRINPSLILRTHARHVLSDTPSAFRFLKDPAFAAFDVLIDAPGMLTPEMLSRPAAAAEHLTRIVEDVLSPACPRRPFAVLLGQPVGRNSEAQRAQRDSENRESPGPFSRDQLESLESQLLQAGISTMQISPLPFTESR